MPRMKNAFVGLNTHHVFFKSKKALEGYANRNKSYDLTEIFVENGYGLEARKRRKVY